MDYDVVAAELVRALRGRRSQTALSRRIRSRSNVVYTWESGRRFPTGAKTLWVAARTGVDVTAALGRFYRTPPAWLARTDPTSPEGVATLLSDLRGNTPIGVIARRAGRSRFAVARWLKGTAEPRLPDFLRMIEATSLRLLDFVAAFVDPERMASLRDRWRELNAARQAAYDLPWSHAVLRVLELDDYHALPSHDDAFVARRLGIEEEHVTRCLAVLAESKQVSLVEGRYVPNRIMTVDTRQQPEHGKKLKEWWAGVALDRLRNGEPGLFSYNLFTVSAADLERLRELHVAYFHQLRTIVAESEPAERVVLANIQLLSFDG